MAGLGRNDNGEKASMKLPTLVQYGVKLPFRVTIVGQNNSGKTHSIIRCCLGGRISFWKYINGKLTMCQLQHCLYCSNGGMSDEEKQRLKDEFIDKERVGMSQQRLLHLNRLTSKKALFEFIAFMSEIGQQPKKKESRKRDKHGASISSRRDIEQIVFSQ